MMLKYDHQMRHLLYNFERHRSYTKKKGTTYKQYCNDILTFDIETTSSWLSVGQPTSYEKGKPSEYWNSLQPLSLCYIWQFSFNDRVFYGRELRDFEQVLNDLPKDMDIVIWVHNLSFEFQFLSNFLEWESVFAKTPHKPMKCVPKKYPNIEFRCSYMLTRLSLEAWGKQLNFPKAVGDLDYMLMRTPLTPLTDREMFYCEQDCRVVYKGIEYYRKKYGTIRNIPLTQTGTVRRVVKEMLMSDEEYAKHIKKLVPASAEQYKMLMEVFAGGYTHANRYYSGRVIKGHIEHYDFASSYPTVMVAEKYPDTKWQVWRGGRLTDQDFEKYAFIMRIKFTKIMCQKFNTYIQSSKATCIRPLLDNGRVLRAEELTMLMTEQDYMTIRESYTWESEEMLECYCATKRYLPKQLIEYILELYGNKTSLKNVEGMEDLYMQSKQYINSLYGMSVTAIVQPNIKYDNGVWTIEDMTTEFVEEKLKKLSDWHEREKRYFLSYASGCWVTAYARRNLWKCMLRCDDKVLYCDTDSIFCLDHQDFTWYNEEITAKLKATCDYYGIDFERTRPKTPKGIAKPLGIFAPEDNCIEFITLGAKRYCERREDNKLYLTVSGINKEAVSVLNNDLENFKDGLDFDKDHPDVNKKLGTYIEDMPTVTYPDGYVSTYKKGINIRNNGYLLGVPDDYKLLMKYASFDLNELDDNVIMRLKASF